MPYGKRINPYKRFTGIFIPQALVPLVEITAGAKLAYGRLARYAGESGRCFPSVETLGLEVGVRERQARSYLAELEGFNLIERVRRGSTSNEYYFYDHPIFDADDCRSDRQDIAGLSGNILPVERSLSYMKRVSEESHLTEAAAAATPKLLTQEEWPQTTGLIQGRFPSVDGIFMSKFVHAAVQAALSAGLDAAEVTDARLRGIVETSFETDKRGLEKYGAGLLMKTVPQIIENLALKHAKVMR